MITIKNPGDLSPLQRKLLTESNGRCYYCGQLLTDHVCIEHVIPRSRGGSDKVANLVASCSACNDKKGVLLISELREKILQKYPVSSVSFYFETAGLKIKGLSKTDTRG